MANIKISKLCPVQFHKSGYGDFAYNLIPGHEAARGWCQPYFHGDSPYFQVLIDTSGATIMLSLIDNAGTVYKNWSVGLTGERYGTDYVYAFINYLPFASTAPEGIYFLKMVVNVGSESATFYSEPIFLTSSKSGTVKIEYDHDENDFDRKFTGNTYRSMIRVEGGMKSDGWAPGGKYDMFQDIDYNSVVLHSTSFVVEKWTFGDGAGIPNWVGDKLNRIFALTEAKIDGVQYSRNEGAKISRVGDSDYPLAGWEIDLVKTENPQSDEFSTELAGVTCDSILITSDSSLITCDNF